MENRKKILLFGLKHEKAEKIRELSEKMGFESEEVPRMRYGESVGALAGLAAAPGDAKRGQIYQGPDLPDEMLVFSGLTSDELDMFLKEYRRAMIAPVALKAVVTPFNMQWTPTQLINELMKEHAAL